MLGRPSTENVYSISINYGHFGDIALHLYRTVDSYTFSVTDPDLCHWTAILADAGNIHKAFRLGDEERWGWYAIL
jgi:hypothetical protein